MISKHCSFEREEPQFAAHNFTSRGLKNVRWVAAGQVRDFGEKSTAYCNYNKKVKVKVKFTLEYVTKAQKWSRALDVRNM
jgi:hypothetical protein